MLVATAGEPAGGGAATVATALRSRRREAFAEAVAADLAAGRTSTGLKGAPTSAEMGRILDGMGEIPHTVTISGIALDEDARRGTVTLEHSWRVHKDKKPWVYRSTAPLRRDDESLGEPRGP